MTFVFTLPGMAILFLILGLTKGQQESCDAIAQASRQQKLQYINEIRNLKNYFNNLFNDYFYEDFIHFYNFNFYHNSLTRKYDYDFADIENKFQVKMSILNETKNIKHVIETQKKNLFKYQESRVNLWKKYYSYSLVNNNILYNIYFTFNQTIMLSTAKCDPCVDTLVYSTCLEMEVKILKTALDQLKFNIQDLTETIETLSKVNRWDFLNNARRTSREVFNALNRTLTVQQIKDYYRTKLVPLYEEIVSVGEKYHKYWRTENLLNSSKILLNIFQFVLGKIKQQVNVESNCDYVTVIKKIVNATSTMVSPYERFPMWSLDDFATKYIRPITNIADVDLLMKILDDALRAAKNETINMLPAIRHVGEENQYINNILLAFIDLFYLVYKGYCPGIIVIREAGRAAWDTFDCFVQIWKTSDQPIYYLEQYLRNLIGAEKYKKCYDKTQNL